MEAVCLTTQLYDEDAARGVDGDDHYGGHDGDEDSPLSAFLDGVKPEYTKKHYQWRLDKIFSFLKIEGKSRAERARSFYAQAAANHKWAKNAIALYVRHLEKKENGSNSNSKLSPGSIRSYVVPPMTTCN